MTLTPANCLDSWITKSPAAVAEVNQSALPPAWPASPGELVAAISDRRIIYVADAVACRRPAQGETVTRRKVAGIEVPPSDTARFCVANNLSNSCLRSAAWPLFSAASKAFMVGP